MRLLAVTGLILVMLLVSLSSYLRLDHSGIGCKPWPDCYGNIGTEISESDFASTYERLLAETRETMSWARPAHRLVASVLGLLVLGIVAFSIRMRRHRRVSFLLLGMTVYLAWLGIYSEGLHNPAVVIGNLAGGFVMLGLFASLVFKLSTRCSRRPPEYRHWLTTAIVLLGLQIFLGGLTSANFAASACPTLPDCQGLWVPGKELIAAFDLSRTAEIDEQGYVVGGDERQAIHMLHRIVALVVLSAVGLVGIRAIRAGPMARSGGIFLCIVVLAEIALGVAAVNADLPISIAVAHNWLAGLLLIGLLRLRTT